MKAILLSDYGMVDFLIDRGANVNITDYRHKTPLMLAVPFLDAETFNKLLDYGAKIDAVDDDGKTALMLAIEYGAQDIAELLSIAGANVNTRDKYGNTSLTRILGDEKARFDFDDKSFFNYPVNPDYISDPDDYYD